LFVSQKGSVHHETLQKQTGVIFTEKNLLFQKDIEFPFVFVKQALFPYVSFRCVCRFCKQMRLVYRQTVRSVVATVTTIEGYPYRDTVARIEKMGNCILDCTGHEFCAGCGTPYVYYVYKKSLPCVTQNVSYSAVFCSNSPLLSSSTPFSVS